MEEMQRSQSRGDDSLLKQQEAFGALREGLFHLPTHEKIATVPSHPSLDT